MFLFVTYQGARAARGRAAGTRQRRGTQASGHLPGPATRLWGQDYGRRSGSRVRRCHRAGWDGRKRGEGRRGVGEAKGVARRAPPPGSSEVRRVQRVARRPPSSSYCCRSSPGLGGLEPDPTRRPRPRGRTPRARTRHRPRPPAGRLRAPRLAQVATRPPRRGHCSPRASYLHGAGGSGSHSGPPGSAAPSPRLPRARRLRAARAAGALGY